MVRHRLIIIWNKIKGDQMKPSYLHTLILYCLKQISGERSFYAIYHLLKGKKSSQTIQDAHLFELTKLFATFPRLKRSDLDDAVQYFLQEGWITNVEQTAVLTALGERELTVRLAANPIPNFLDGWKYHQLSDLVWKRLTLLVQVCSNFVHKESRYIPVQKDRDIQFWLKKFLVQTNLDRVELASLLYKELVDGFDQDDDVDPALLVIRLSGYNQVGLTPLQAAELLNMELTLYHIQFLNLLHLLLYRIQNTPMRYKLLNQLISDVESQIVLTNSAEKTYKLLQAGYTIEQISKIRKLKRNTIEDHLVEITLNVNHFEIASFVDEDKQKRITAAYEKANSRQLKVIRAFVEDASYFDIRLVLAKRGV